MSEPNQDPNSNPLLDPTGTNAEQTSASPPENAGADSLVSATAVSETTATSSTEEGLPDWEPLTPEIVEDEAIRGDFMLRWAVVLLALLIGCRQIVETRTLVHVKTGQYLSAHGYLPPPKDVFSSTATERPWVNLSWLWDLISSGLFAVGSGVGLSLGTALLVAATWWLLGKTSRSNVSTWWGSILGAVTLLACHPQFSGQPETVTLFGLAVLFWVLHSWRESSAAAVSTSVVSATRHVSLWWLVPGFAVWSNVDSHLFLGLAALLLWGFGETLGGAFGRGVLSAAQRKQYWMVFCGCVAASLLNPFGWHSLLAPFTAYGVEYPAIRSYVGLGLSWHELEAFSLASPAVWMMWNQSIVCGVVVLLAGLLMWCLNFRRASWGDGLTLIGMTSFAFLAAHELTAAAVVACVVGSLNGQQWYQARFRQTYSIEKGEVLFTRGGRAMTVMVFFVLAVLAVNQQLFGVFGKRVGLGLSANLKSLIDGYRDAVADSLDDRPFNVAPEQGDVLIWLGQKPFVDNRLAMFSGRGDDDLLKVHHRTRQSLVTAPRQKESDGLGTTGSASETTSPEQPSSDEWKATFERWKISHVIPRLVNARPIMYFKLLTSSDWQLTHFGPVCAVFYRRESTVAATTTYLDGHRLNFLKKAMQTETPPSSRSDWPRPRTTFQKYFAPPEPRVSNPIREAETLNLHLTAMTSAQLAMDQALAASIALLTIRKANEGLAESVDQPAAYRVLADVYSFLDDLEISLLRQSGIETSNSMRFNQAMAAFQQAVLLDSESSRLHFRFMQFLHRHHRIDLALRELDEVDRLTVNSELGDDEVLQMAQQIIPLREQYQSLVEKLREDIDRAQQQGESDISLAQMVYQAGFVREALKLMNGDLVGVEQSPAAQTLRGVLLFESGQVEAAYNQFEYATDQNRSAWQIPAAWLRLAHGEYDRAISLWNQQIEIGQQSVTTRLMFSLPLLQSPLYMSNMQSVWPVQHAVAVADSEFRWREEESLLLWYRAMSQLESGSCRLAGKTIAGMLEQNPETSFRPLARFYLYLITDELIDAEPPSDWIPIDGEMFAPDSEAEAKNSGQQ